MPLTHDSGFSIFPSVLGMTEVDGILELLSHVEARRSRAGLRHVLAEPGIRSLALDPCLVVIASDVLGTTAHPFRATLFHKSRTRNWLVVWHQDTALPIRDRLDVPGWGPWSVKAGVVYAHAPTRALARTVALRVHLDESTSANGPLRVLPGTHRLGVLTDRAVQKLARQVVPVECLVDRGGVVTMRPLLIHSSSKSISGAPRRVLHIEYTASFEVGDGLELAVA